MEPDSLKVSCGTALGGGVGPGIPAPKEELKLNHLLTVINTAIDRNSAAIDRYRIMNDGLIGCEPLFFDATPDKDSKAELIETPGGLIFRLIERSEFLLNLCTNFDNQNSRLNQIVTDEQNSIAQFAVPGKRISP